ncbi:MAG: RidA family protein [Aestuariivita sp.]|nr:RidA family protein [Aestuariivita sp.]
MTIQRISSGGLYEKKVGYCRAVVAGGFVFVAGTTAQGTEIPPDVVGQCRSALGTIRKALKEAGSDMNQVVRVTYMLSNIEDFPACWPILVDIFGENPPAGTVFECKLVNPKYLIEIEVTALVA